VLIDRRQDHGLELHSIPYWDHHLGKLENGLAREFLRLSGNRQQSCKNGN